MIGRCNLCGFIIINLKFARLGMRCLGCLSTQVHRSMCIAIDSLNIGVDEKIHELSSRGALVHHLRKKFTHCGFSEYFPEIKSGEYRNGVRCEDIQALSFADNTFSLLTSTEVFEHVPNDQQGFQEVARVLKPGGFFVFTVPLNPKNDTITRAVMNADGTIQHLLPPEYHDDRIRGRGKILSFRTYGKDIIANLKQVGLTAEIITVDRPELSIRRQHVVVCKKSL